MTIAPAGNPFWLRAPGIGQYGGDVNKKDYGGIGTINAQTDLSAAQYCRLTADAAALARVAPLLRMQFTPHATAPTTSVELCAPAWATPTTYTDGGAAPSSVYPTVTGTGTTRTIVLLPSAADDYGIVGDISPKIAMVTGGVWDGQIVGIDGGGGPVVLPIMLGWGVLGIVEIHVTINSVTNGTPVVVTLW